MTRQDFQLLPGETQQAVRAARVLCRLPHHQGLGKHSLALLINEKPCVALFFQRRFVQIVEQAPACQCSGTLRRRCNTLADCPSYARIRRTCTHTCNMVDRDPSCKHARCVHRKAPRGTSCSGWIGRSARDMGFARTYRATAGSTAVPRPRLKA